MKLFKRIAIMLVTVSVALSAVSCASSSKAMADHFNGASSSTDSDSVVQRPAGLLTACAWNDNDQYDKWTELFLQGKTENGKFVEYIGKNSWGFNSLQRIKVTVNGGEENLPAAGVEVVCKDTEGKTCFAAVTDANGVAYLFTELKEGTVAVTAGESTVEENFSANTRELALHLDRTEEKPNRIELMFVVDVTGSMGDELDYLKNEIADVVGRVVTANDGVQISLALLFYRDHSDKETFRYYDFTNVNDPVGLQTQQEAIDVQSATGGGDWPEAVDEALQMAVEKQWGSDASTKIIFQVLDAPPHSGAQYQTTYHGAVMTAAKKGIRICPVICSGADVELEYLVRQAAIYTAGTFVYLTDDSGIGNEHYDPGLENVTVEALNSLMVRLINGYHSGTFADPVDWRQELGETKETEETEPTE